MLCHGILNMQETKYGVEPNEIILKTCMIREFEEMCGIHEPTVALVHFFYPCRNHVYSTMKMYIYLLHFVSMFVGEGRSGQISKTS